MHWLEIFQQLRQSIRSGGLWELENLFVLLVERRKLFRLVQVTVQRSCFVSNSKSHIQIAVLIQLDYLVGKLVHLRFQKLLVCAKITNHSQTLNLIDLLDVQYEFLNHARPSEQVVFLSELVLRNLETEIFQRLVDFLNSS